MIAPFTAAVVQATPAFMNKSATLDKVMSLTQEAVRHGAKLIVFPETFIPGYPRGLSFGATVGNRTQTGRELYLTYWENAMEVPGKETDALGKLAKDLKCFLVIGITEKDTINDSLYCSVLYFSPEGQLLQKHRKVKPTASERIIWGEGDGRDLEVCNTSIGKIGGLICWENYMPLARTALYEQGIEIYVSPTADSRETWLASLQHIACEGRCFVLSSNQFISINDYPIGIREQFTSDSEPLCRGGSAIISPMGKILAGPVYDREEIMYSEIDHREIVKAKMDFDVIGHYTRPDIFHFEWKRDEQRTNYY